MAASNINNSVNMPGKFKVTDPESTERKNGQKERKKIGTDRIVGSNWCTMWLYNIPRASLMITVPGLVLVICGAAMTAFKDNGQSWIDGIALIALISICVGGALTVGGLVYWFIVWFRYKPPMRKRNKKVTQSTLAQDGENINLEAVYTYPSADIAVISSAVGSNTSNIENQQQQQQSDADDGASAANPVEVHAETVFVVP